MNVDLHSNFHSPAVRAKLDVLMLFAGTARKHLALFYDRLPNHYRVFLKAVADAVAEAIDTPGTPATVDEVWTSILGAQKVQRLLKLPDAVPVIQTFETSLRINAKTADYALSYLDRANDRATKWIGELGKDVAQYATFPSFKDVPVRRLQVAFDPMSKSSCAASSRSGPISWSLQPKSFAFYGAILPELMFVHEYLCHVLPTNQYLEKDVREVWLNDCIYYGVRNLADPDNEREPAKYVWERFLHLYEEHFASDPYALGSSGAMDQITRALSGRQLFWKITLAIYSSPNTQEASDTISQVFNALSKLTDWQLAALDVIRWTTLPQLIQTIDIVKSIT